MKTGEHIEIQIAEMAFGGQGVGKVPTAQGDFVVFVPDVLPGQRVQVRIVKKKKTFAEAKLVKVLQPAPEEKHMGFQRIAGAPFANLPIEKQIEYKEHSTLEMFRRLSGIEGIRDRYDEYIASPQVWHYRNKMEYSFSTLLSDVQTQEESVGFALGFKRRGQWWAVENLDADSGLFDAQLEGNLHRIRQFCEATGLPAYNPAKSEGFFRFLVARKSHVHDALLLNLVVTSMGLENFDKQAFVALLQDILGQRLAGVWLTRNDDAGDNAKQPSELAELLYGQPKIEEIILGLRFEISMQSFFQTNPRCAELLYTKALQYVEESASAGGVVMDLFCGTGTIAQLLSRLPSVQKVVGVDIVPEAIEDAKANAARNGIAHIDFYAADVGKFLYEYPHFRQKISTIVLDPPRAGIAPKTLQKVIGLEAKAIVYISCNPSTQARDAQTLLEAGYTLRRFALVDQFPHTAHIESVALFMR